MTDIASLGLEVKSDGVVVASDRLKTFSKDAGGAERATGGLTTALRALTPVMSALAAAFSLRAMSRYADQWSTIQWRLRNATSSAQEAAAAMERISSVARNTWSSVDQTAESFLRQEAAMSALGYTVEQQLDSVEALNAALLISGLRGQRAEQVSAAWARAMSRGSLRGDEFNSVVENSSRLTQALADAMGVSVVELRQLAADGKITSDVMFGITESLEDLRKELEGDATLAGSLIVLGNAFMEFVGRVDGALGATSSLGMMVVGVADMIRSATGPVVEFATLLGDNFERVLYWAAAVGTYLAVSWAASFVTAARVTKLLTAGLGLLRGALIRLGFGLVLVAIGEVIYQFMQLVERTGGVGEAFGLLGEVAVAVWEGISVSAQGLIPALNAVWLEVQADFINMIRRLSGIWNAFLEEFEAPALTVTIGGKTHELIGGFDLSSWKVNAGDLQTIIGGMRSDAAELREEASALASEGIGAISSALRRLVDGYQDSIGDGAVFSDLREFLGGDGSGGGGSDLKDGIGGLSEEAKKLAEAYLDIVDGANAFIAAQQLEASVLGMTEVQANTLRYAQDLLNQAQSAGIELTAAQTNELLNLGAQMAEAEDRTRSLTEAYNFSRSTFQGFFQDLRKGLMDGSSLWETFGNAVVSVLDKIASKLMDMATSGLFDMLWGGIMSGLGGGFGSPASFIPGGYFPAFPSFDGGGFTGAGPRSGGVDGRGGFPAILHPNETVVDHSQGGSGRGDINIVINGSGLSREELAGAIDDALMRYDQGLAPRVESKVRTMQTDPRSADGGW